MKNDVDIAASPKPIKRTFPNRFVERTVRFWNSLAPRNSTLRYTKFMMRYQTKSRYEMGSLYKIKLYIPV